MRHIFGIIVSFLFAMVFITPALYAANAGEVVVYNWSDYISDEILKQFEKETGIKVRYTTYDSNEEMLENIEAKGFVDYDVIFPSTYYIDVMKRKNLIQPVDHVKLRNFKNIDPLYINKLYDPANKFSIPFMISAVGIGVNTKYINASKVTKWSDLWKEEFKGKVLLMDNMRDVFDMGLKSLGRKINSKQEDYIKEAYERLKELHPNVKVYAEGTQEKYMVDETAYVGLMWAGDAYRASLKNPNIVFVYPSDGALIWGDNMVITSRAKNLENAYKFIDFLLRPEISAKISEYMGYTSPLYANLIKEYMSNKSKNSNVIFPMLSDLKKAEWQLDVGVAFPIYKKYWDLLRNKK